MQHVPNVQRNLDLSQISTTGFRREIGEIINRAAYGHERILLQRLGKNVLAVIPVDDYELLQELEDRIDSKRMGEALEEADRDGTIPHEQVRKELGLGSFSHLPRYPL